MSISKHLTRFYTVLYTSNISQLYGVVANNGNRFSQHSNPIYCPVSKIHSTPRNFELMEFFDDKENWVKDEIPCGRSWKLDELRIKSNSDLHKLWFVLLKERNMLLTMEHEYKERYVPMPSPERIYKVHESMANLETVVRERNRAFYELETGETGERQIVDDYNGFGLPYKRKLKEHIIERKFNERYKKFSRLKHNMVINRDVVNFLKLYNEKERKKQWARHKGKYRHVCGLLRRFSDIDEEALKEEFPDIDIEEAKRDKMSRGPRLNEF